VKFPLFFPPRRVRVRPRLARAFLRPWVPVLARAVLPLYLRLLGYSGMKIEGKEEARRLWRDFYAGKNRVILTFRHALGNDPQLTAAAVLRGVPKGFTQFVHGVEVGWWAGALARWIIPRSGGIGVDHDALGTASLQAIRTALVSGAHPLALAPEGQVTYESRTVQRVQPGAVRLGFLAAEDLAAAGKPVPVLVVPLSLFHVYPRGTDLRVARAVADLELAVLGATSEGALWQRLLRLRDGLFLQAEEWYSQRHRHPASTLPWSKERLLPLLEAALTAGEDLLGLTHEGEFFTRMYRVRSHCWTRFIPDADRWESLTTLGKGFASRSFTEAWAAFRHLELADIGWYLFSTDPHADSDTAYLADFTENLYDVVNRLMGGNISHRRVLFPRSVRVIFGSPLDLTARLDDYRRAKKDTVVRTLKELVESWTKTAEEYSHE